MFSVFNAVISWSNLCYFYYLLVNYIFLRKLLWCLVSGAGGEWTVDRYDAMLVVTDWALSCDQVRSQPSHYIMYYYIILSYQLAESVLIIP